jgi:hypothetical protein
LLVHELQISGIRALPLNGEIPGGALPLQPSDWTMEGEVLDMLLRTKARADLVLKPRAEEEEEQQFDWSFGQTTSGADHVDHLLDVQVGEDSRRAAREANPTAAGCPKRVHARSSGCGSGAVRPLTAPLGVTLRRRCCGCQRERCHS